jgi:hypothetical protein
MPEMTQQVPPQIPEAFATTSTPATGTVTDPAAAAPTVAPAAPVAAPAGATAAAPAAATAAAPQAGGGVASALVSLFRGMFDAPTPLVVGAPAAAPPAQEDLDLPVAIGNGVKDGYDANSSPVPGVDAPENPVSENLGWWSQWWPTMKGVYEMGTKGPEEADAGTVGGGATSALKTLASTWIDAHTAPGVSAMIGQVIDSAQQVADLFVPHKDGVNGMVGEEVKKTGTMIKVAGGQVLDDVTGAVNTVGGGAVGAVDSVVAAAQHSLGVDDGTPVDLPMELPPIEERMDTEWPPPMAPAAPAAPAAPMQTVTLPAEEANPLAV